MSPAWPSGGTRAILGLIPFAFLGQALSAGLAMLLASRLSPPEFEAYAVAVAAFLLMSAIAPLGSEKLALRVLPPLVARGDTGEFRAYVAFATRRCLRGSAIAIAVCLAVILLPDTRAPTRIALVMGCLALPAAALAHLALEVLTASGYPGRATVIFRVVVPATAGLIVLILFAETDSGAAAIAAWAAGWVLAVGMMRRLAPARWPVVALRGASDPAWLAASRPLWLYRLAAGVLSQAGVLALEIDGAAPVEIGAYAAAMSLVGLAGVLVSATNRVYAREMGACLARGDMEGIVALRRRRAAWLAPILAGLVALAFLFTDPLLALYRPEFVAPGRAPFRLLAVTAAISMLFALAPTILKFRGESGPLIAILSGVALLQLALLALFVPRFGATAAAGSALAATVLLFGLCLARSRRALSPMPR